MMASKIVEHGVRWYFGKYQPKCPECNNSNVQFILRTDRGMIKTATVVCSTCGCVWEQTREVRA